VIAATLVVTATVDDEDIRHALEAMKDDPQELLTFLESVLAKVPPGDSSETA
jgi:hypothetical protein